MTDMTSACNAPVLDTLSSRRLPVIPIGTFDLLAALDDDSIGFREIATVLERFPTIAARLIQLANSSWSSPVAEVSSLDAACSRLGVDVVKSTSVALLVSAPFDPCRCPAFEPRRYWARALAVAEAASHLAACIGSEAGGGDLQSARTAGLLHNLGLLWLADQLPEPTHLALLKWARDPDVSLDRSLMELAGAGYRQAGGCLARAWGLPSSLVTALEHQGRDRGQADAGPLAKLTGMAVSMVAAAEAGSGVPAHCAADCPAVPAADAERVYRHTAQQLERIEGLAGSLFDG
ncbi:MAG TPA: HDOD domain-containing protein [Sedimenticola thiotaurini]|uniref:HDOD domain-containing protein n=1 Tax=Sedimenticola thiotaurini TaxID=1543721 RepID=A0A831W9R1_9GAMM|nr:HDOD domain-containing protein [Sedimenticola thiotaurini]